MERQLYKLEVSMISSIKSCVPLTVRFPTGRFRSILTPTHSVRHCLPAFLTRYRFPVMYRYLSPVVYLSQRCPNSRPIRFPPMNVPTRRGPEANRAQLRGVGFGFPVFKFRE